jgi:hypothetical protein
LIDEVRDNHASQYVGDTVYHCCHCRGLGGEGDGGGGGGEGEVVDGGAEE